MYEREPGVFDVYSGERYLRVIEECNEDNAVSEGRPRKYTFFCSGTEFDLYWRRYFDLDRDYASIVHGAVESGDTYIAGACRKYSGIRILHQDIWEMMISFIISQQKQIPSIRKCIEGLCERYGTEKSTSVERNGIKETVKWYTFPTAEAIAAGGLAGLDGQSGLSLGYRQRYIYETAVQYLDRGIANDALEAMAYDGAKKYLLSFTGIGEKVANCILLFGAGFVDAFPIDTHIKDILYREYYVKYTANNGKETILPQEKLTQADYEGLTKENFGRYSPNRGIVQQWIFAAEIE